MARYQAGLRTEARITEATRELLGEVGLEATTLKAICDRAGVRAGSFYNLFDSKEEVVLRVVGEAIAAVDPDPEGRNTDTVQDLVEAYITFITEQSTVAKIYLQIAVSGAIKDGKLGKRVFRHHESRTARFAEALLREQPELDRAEAEVRTEILLATLNGLAFRWMLDPKFDFAHHARQATLAPTTTPAR
jgi:AcrR family transcriptional regulator